MGKAELLLSLQPAAGEEGEEREVLWRQPKAAATERSLVTIQAD